MTKLRFLGGVLMLALLPVSLIVVLLVRLGDRWLHAYDQLAVFAVRMPLPPEDAPAWTVTDQLLTLAAGIGVGATLPFWVWN